MPASPPSSPRSWTPTGPGSKVEQAPANAKLYSNGALGAQLTGGSSAISNSWDQLRKAGAGARAMFVQAAAAKWNVPVGEITVKDSVVTHTRQDRRLRRADGRRRQGHAARPSPA
jgi:CO/xanthine dehydrogenase Mo-binding subunit